MLVKDLLQQKGGAVITITAGATAREAMARLVEHRIGALVVVGEDGLPQGIITERDFLRLSLEKGGALAGLPVGQIMTARLIVGLPTDSLDYLMAIMTANRVRHVPIVAEHTLVGIISIGDLVKALLRETRAENRYLQDYVCGKYPC